MVDGVILEIGQDVILIASQVETDLVIILHLNSMGNYVKAKVSKKSFVLTLIAMVRNNFM